MRIRVEMVEGTHINHKLESKYVKYRKQYNKGKYRTAEISTQNKTKGNGTLGRPEEIENSRLHNLSIFIFVTQFLRHTVYQRHISVRVAYLKINAKKINNLKKCCKLYASPTPSVTFISEVGSK